MSKPRKWIAALLVMLMVLSGAMTAQAFAIDIDIVDIDNADIDIIDIDNVDTDNVDIDIVNDVMFSRDPALPDSDFDGIPDAYDTAPDSNVFTGKLKSGHDGTTTVSYTMDYRVFFGDNTSYSPELGTVSVMGAALAYYAADYSNAYFTFDVPQTWEGGTASKVSGVELMQILGFEDVVDFSLDTVYSDDDLCEALFGHRTVTFNGETKVIVAIWVRGTKATSQEEWSSNFHMGDLVRFFDQYDSVAGKSPRQSNDDWTRKTNHRGFDVCATRLLNYLKDYYLDPYVQPAREAAADATLAYWLTGHSRGASVANLMASYLIDEGSEVFAYTFAAPYNTANTEASAEKYDCIFNLINSNDFMPRMPMPEWGFTRYGKTAMVDGSAYSSQIQTATGETYSGNYLTASEMSTLLGKFICITGENADRNNPGKILGWREVYVYHCGHTHEGETVGNYQSTTFRAKGNFLTGPTESDYNGYATRLRKYSYWEGGICQTPAYDLQVLVELLVQVAQGNTVGGGWNYLTSNKLADKFDFDKQSLINYATKLTEAHLMDTYSVIQAQINSAGSPGERFQTLSYYTATDTAGGRPSHTHTYTYVSYEGHEPTCTEPGLGYRFCVCSETNADYYDDYQKNIVIPATGHNWGEVSYTWAGDNSTVTAERVCANDSAHVETETVYCTVATTAATCTEDGKTVYTATFTNTAFETQTKEVTIEATGHDWGEPTYEWAADNSTVTATRVCANDSTHIETETVNTTYAVTTPATYDAPGVGTYTAAFGSEAFETQTKDVEIPQLVVEGYHINVADYTKGAATTSLVADQLYSGEVTFTVSCSDVCKVGLVNADGTITKLACTTTGDEHSFTVTVTDADVNLVIVIKGDANLDGSLKGTDATYLKKYFVDLVVMDESTAAVQAFAGDVTDDGKLKQIDATTISKVLVDLATLTW